MKTPSTLHIWHGREVYDVASALTSIILHATAASVNCLDLNNPKLTQFAMLDWKEVSPIIFSITRGKNCLINILHLYGSAMKRFLFKNSEEKQVYSASNKSRRCKSITIVASLQFNKTLWRPQGAKLQQFPFFLLSRISSSLRSLQREKEKAWKGSEKRVSHSAVCIKTQAGLPAF